MPRVKRPVPVTVDGVPVALLTRLDPVWESDAATSEWCLEHDLPVVEGKGPLTRFIAAAEAFAIQQGWYRTYGGSEVKNAHWGDLRSAGVPMFGCALEMQEEHYDHSLTDAEWAWIAQTEAKYREKGSDRA
ncbi:hypothetical protein [Agromyces sp. NPDC057865]|uniref:hypothetical protein n=1 Tax=Agromyces sp. NPDC057865 TaxID=3346267 RepID=UPI00366F65D8